MNFLKVGDSTIFPKPIILPTKVLITSHSNDKHSVKWKAGGPGQRDVSLNFINFTTYYEYQEEGAIAIGKISFSKPTTAMKDGKKNANELMNYLSTESLTNLLIKKGSEYLRKEIEFWEFGDFEFKQDIIDQLKELLQLSNSGIPILRIGAGQGKHSITGDPEKNHLKLNGDILENKSRKVTILPTSEGSRFLLPGFISFSIISEEEKESLVQKELNEIQEKKNQKIKELENSQELERQKQAQAELQRLEALKPVEVDFNSLKDGATFDAEVIGAQPPMIILKPFGTNFPQQTIKARYPKGFPVGTILTVTLEFLSKKSKDFNCVKFVEKA